MMKDLIATIVCLAFVAMHFVAFVIEDQRGH